MRKLLLSSVLLLSLPAAAWESVCYEHKDTSKEPGEYPRGSGTYCAPAAGPNTARQRWVGELDEHRRLWELTREKAGLQRIVSLTRLMAKARPEGTDLADGRFGDFLGAKPNGEYVGALASYVDPLLPWPATPDAVAAPLAGERAMALARVFHRGHAADWCRTASTDGLSALKSRASDVTLDEPTRAAACEVCSEFAVRHLRVGTSVASYDTSAEPVCHYLSAGPYLYQPGPGTPEALARTWCGCP